MQWTRASLGPMGAGILGLLLGVAPALGQDFEGQVVDAVSATPIPGALVEIQGEGLVTVADDEGRFSFLRVGADVDSVVISRFGYVTFRTQVEFASVGARVWELLPDPLELEAVTAEIGFEERFEILRETLDTRVGSWPGAARVAGPEDLRPYDEDWEDNPWKFLHYGPLKVSWLFNASLESEDPVYIRGYGRAIPEVYIDDRLVWLDVLIATPNEQLCRAEVYAPKRFTRQIQPPAQIRAYTCSFMGRVAMRLAEICPSLQWGGLIAGPAGPRSLRLAPSPNRRRRPAGSPTPIDLGPGLDLSAATIGVGSGACR